MANLTFTLSEVITLIKLNTELPKQIEKINIVGNRIKLRINIGKFIPNFNVFVSFHSFENGMIKFKIDFGKVLKIFSKYFFKIIKKKLTSKIISFHNGEMLHIALNEILKKKVKGIQIKSIIEKNDVLNIAF